MLPTHCQDLKGWEAVERNVGVAVPAGHESNWLQTVPGKGWNTIFRINGALEPWFDKTWKPGEIEPMK